MKITADTNLLVRAATGDDAAQAAVAAAILRQAELIAVPLAVLCEFVWVLARGYRIPQPAIALAVRRLIESGNVVAERAAAEAGLALLESGGDFADGVIAFEGRRLGGELFTSFDADAVKRVVAAGGRAQLLAAP